MNHYFSRRPKIQVACLTMWGNWRERIGNRPYLISDGYVAIYQ